MARIRLALLWHMHQPFYKDLVTGSYRLPWVRLHGLKDYYGMVKLLDEFPDVRQTFNLVPSLITQLQDYVQGTAQDPFLQVAAKPAPELTPEERRFALAYLFQANPIHMIARYPRYEELHLRFRGAGESPERALPRFDSQDFTDLQVLSQLAWFDEFFLEEPEVAALVRKGKGYSREDQRLVIGLQQQLLARVLPAYADAARRGAIEISTSPYYHPILPLLCDTDAGAVSTPGLKLPQRRFQHPEDAETQLERGLSLHERVFGMRPRGAWPSEGSISEAALQIGARVGLEWMASDEGVLARTLDFGFSRDSRGALHPEGAERLYRVYRYEAGEQGIYLLFRDHVLSDLIGFVYSGMPAAEAAADFVARIKESARPVLAQGRDAIVSIMLDGENAWEYYAGSGREFLRRFYDAIQQDPQIEAVTISQAIREEEITRPDALAVRKPSVPVESEARPAAPLPAKPEPASLPDRRRFVRLNSLVPGSWIHANFNVWIGAPEDNRSWDYLSAARDFYANYGMTATEEQRALAFEEILIAEGSDWNWWYGPEHHSANDRDFDQLYRKHLSNVYLALGARPPDHLAQPITVAAARPIFVAQTAYIHPRIGAAYERYFDWIGAAMYTSDHRAGAMHGKQFLLDSIRAGIDEVNLYGRLDFAALPEDEFEVRVNLECTDPGGGKAYALTLECIVDHGSLGHWLVRETDSQKLIAGSQTRPDDEFVIGLRRNFGFQLPLRWLRATPNSVIRLRFALWHNRLPLDALPLEGWLELPVVAEDELQVGMHV